MKMSLQDLIQATKSMDAAQFEEYCSTHGIRTEWLEVCVTDFNDGIYNVTLPDYDDTNVFAMNGDAIEID